MKVSSLVKFPSMVKPRICQICNRTFASGKAMGGHMRSHLAKLPLPPKPEPNSSYTGHRLISSVNSGGSSSSAPTLREVVLVGSVRRSVPYETGNTASEKNPPTGKRSAGRQARRRATTVTLSTTTVAESSSTTTSNSVSSLSQPPSDEEIAQCLLKLLHEKRPPAEVVHEKYEEAEESDEEDHDEDEDFEEEEEEEACFTIIKRKRKFSSLRGKYKCETCNRVFRSYQALGGHRASHKNKRLVKNNNNILETNDDDESGKRMVVVERRRFPCPFCKKVFDSGQALGGHKKVHLSYLGIGHKTAVVPNIPVKNDVKSSTLLLDLNLPAPAEEGGEE